MAWRPRWWHWTIATIVLALALPVAAAVAWRMIGFRRYDAVVAEQRARGVPTTVDELIALAPAVDRERQARWKAWMARWTMFAQSEVGIGNESFDRWMRDRDAVPQEKVDHLAQLEPLLIEMRSLDQEGPFVLSSFGWIRQHFADGRRDLDKSAALPGPDVVSCGSAAAALMQSALRVDDPSPYLRDLDVLLAALSRPATQRDANVLFTVSTTRDNAYLRMLTAHGRVDDRTSAWLDEQPDHLRQAADGLRGERLLTVGPLMSSERQQSLAWSDNCLYSWHGVEPRHRASWFVQTPNAGALACLLEEQLESRLRHVRPTAPAWLPAAISMNDNAGNYFFARLFAHGGFAWESETAHRIKRMAARLLTASNVLPVDDLAFATAYADDRHMVGGPDRATLAYERLSTNRFRISISPATPVPDFAFSDRVKKGLMVGKPSKTVGKEARVPFLFIDRFHVEVEVAVHP